MTNEQISNDKELFETLEYLGARLNGRMGGDIRLFLIPEDGVQIEITPSWEHDAMVKYAMNHIVLKNWWTEEHKKNSELIRTLSNINIIGALREKYPELTLVDAKKLVVDKNQEEGFKLAIQYLKSLGYETSFKKLMDDTENKLHRMQMELDENKARLKRIKAVLDT